MTVSLAKVKEKFDETKVYVNYMNRCEKWFVAISVQGAFYLAAENFRLTPSNTQSFDLYA